MTTAKNPLRTLASTLVSACRSQGLKQSVVLHVLTKQAGYHSIQCLDNRAPTSSAKVPLHVMSHLRMVFCQHYGGHNSDMLAADFVEHGHVDTLPDDAGDSLFQAAWAQLSASPADITTWLEGVLNTFGDMRYSLEDHLEAYEEKGVRFANRPADLNTWASTYPLPAAIQHFVSTELIEGLEEQEKEGDMAVWLSGACRLIQNMHNDLEYVYDALCDDPICTRIASA